MPAMDLAMISHIGREIHPVHAGGLMAEDEVCPWTLFLTMALTLLKGVMPHVPKMLPVLISDPVARERAAMTLESEDFQNNIEQYFIENIKNDVQAPLNRQIIKSSETIATMVEVTNRLMNAFFGTNSGLIDAENFEGTYNDIKKSGTADKPRSGDLLNGNTLGQVLNFAKTMYSLFK